MTPGSSAEAPSVNGKPRASEAHVRFSLFLAGQNAPRPRPFLYPRRGRANAAGPQDF